MVSHPLKEIIPGFDIVSYYAGITTAFAEVVNAGCKKLALSSPYEYDLVEKILPATRYAAKEHNVKLMIEPDLLVSNLFPKNIAKDKTVILIARDQSIIDEYLSLKELKQRSIEEGFPEKLETDIARRFGLLLSYDEETINRLINKNNPFFEGLSKSD